MSRKESVKYGPMKYSTTRVDFFNLGRPLHRYFKVFKQRWYFTLIFLLLGTGIQGYRAYTTPDNFRSYSIVNYRKGMSGSSIPTSVLNELSPQFIDTQILYMMSPELHGIVRKKMEEIWPAASYKVNATVNQPSRGAANFQLIVESDYFDYAKSYTTNWANEFLVLSKRIKDEGFNQSSASANEDLLVFEEKLANAREEIARFKKEHQIGSTREAGVAAEERYNKLENELAAIRLKREQLENQTKEQIADGAGTALNSATSQGSSLTESVGDVSDPMGEASQRYRDLKTHQRILEGEYNRLLVDLKPKHPYMLHLQLEIQKAKEGLEIALQDVEDVRNATIKQFRIEENARVPQLNAARETLLAKDSILNEFQRLEENEQSYKDAVDRLKKDKTTTELMRLNDDEFKAVQLGVGKPNPIYPNRLKMVLIGLLSGLSAGLGLAYLFHRLDDRLEDAEAISKALDAPLVGIIPDISKETTEIPEGDGKKPFSDRLLVLDLKKHHGFCEAMRTIRSAITLAEFDQNKEEDSTGNRMKVFVISSAIPGDGKTTFTTNFAVTLAMAGYRVLLVDADMRRGRVHNLFDKTKGPGLSDILSRESSWQDCVYNINGEVNPKFRKVNGTFDLITCGSATAQPGELLQSPEAKSVILQLRKHYEYVIFDSPPLSGLDDTFPLAKQSDGLLFIVRAGQTPMKLARMALEMAAMRAVPLLGVIVNSISASQTPYYYYYRDYYAATAAIVEEEEAQAELSARNGSAKEAAKATSKAEGNGAESLTGGARSKQSAEHKPKSRSKISNKTLADSDEPKSS